MSDSSTQIITGAEQEVIRHVVEERKETIEGIIGVLSAIVGEGEVLSATISVVLTQETNRIEAAGGDSYSLLSLGEVRAFIKRIDVKGDVDMQNALKDCVSHILSQARW